MTQESATAPPTNQTEAAPGSAGSFIARHWDAIIILAFLLLGILLRFWDLGSRAMHHDESLHAFYSWQLYIGRGYQHNPMMHGPFQFHLLAFMYFLLGDNEFTARVGPALFGVVLIGLPYLLRERLGRFGAVATSFLILISPTLLYFSRFIRNDIHMAVWEVGLAICMWKYLASRKTLYLYITAAILSLSFTTMETTFITVVIFGSFLFFMLFWDLLEWRFERRRQTTTQSAAGIRGVWGEAIGWVRSDSASGLIALFVVYFTLSLPQGGALLGLVQDRLGVTLVSPAESWAAASVGAPLGAGVYIAAATVFVLLAISAAIGQRWNWRVWLGCAAIFYVIYFVLYTSLFTSFIGFGSGMWQSLGYWLAQQGVARGSQPWYYYLLIVPLYEFLPLTFALAGTVYYAWRSKDPFNWFLIYWAVAALVLYTRAGEKMPWLSVHVVLPVVLLGGRFLGEVAEKAPWRSLLQRGGAMGLLLLPLFLITLAAIGGFQPTVGTLPRSFEVWVLVGIAMLIIAAGAYFTRMVGWRGSLQVAAASVFLILTLFTVRAALLATYRHGDIPVEMLVYTQTSPDIPRVMKDIDRLAQETGLREKLPITIDTTSGFSWPWVWYLRDYKAVESRDYSTDASTPPSGQVFIVHASNESRVRNLLSKYGTGQRIPLRWWFPEDYRNLTLPKLLKGIADPGTRTKVWNFILYRQLANPLGSEDAIAYFPVGFK